MQELVALLSSDVLAVRLQALQSLHASALAHEGGRSGAIAEGTAPHLVGMLSQLMWFKSEAGLASLQLLLTLSAGSAGRAAEVAAGALAALVGLLSRPSGGERQLLALRLLNTLASSDAGGLSADRIRMELVVQGAVPPLVALLSGKFAPESLALVANALGEIAKNKATSPSLLSFGAVSPLAALLASEDSLPLAQGAWALSWVACTNESRRELYEEGMLPTTVALLRHESPDVQAAAAAIIAALAGRDPRGFGSYSVDPTQEEQLDDIGALPLDIQLFAEANVVGVLVELLGQRQEGSKEVQTQAAHAIMQLCAVDRLHEPFIAAGALPRFLQLLCDGTLVAQGYAGTTLRFLATSKKRLEAIQASIPGPSDGDEDDGGEKHRNIMRKLKHYCY